MPARTLAALLLVLGLGAAFQINSAQSAGTEESIAEMASRLRKKIDASGMSGGQKTQFGHYLAQINLAARNLKKETTKPQTAPVPRKESLEEWVARCDRFECRYDCPPGFYAIISDAANDDGLCLRAR